MVPREPPPSVFIFLFSLVCLLASSSPCHTHLITSDGRAWTHQLAEEKRGGATVGSPCSGGGGDNPRWCPASHPTSLPCHGSAPPISFPSICFFSQCHRGLGQFGFHVWIWFAPISFALIWVSPCFHFCLSFLLQLH